MDYSAVSKAQSSDGIISSSLHPQTLGLSNPALTLLEEYKPLVPFTTDILATLYPARAPV